MIAKIQADVLQYQVYEHRVSSGVFRLKQIHVYNVYQMEDHKYGANLLII